MWLFIKLNIDFWYYITSCGFCPCSLFFMRRWKPDDTLVSFFQLPGFGCLNYLGGLFHWVLFVTFSRARVDLLHAVPQNFHSKWTEYSQCENGCQYYKLAALQLSSTLVDLGQSYLQLREVELRIKIDKIDQKRSLSKGPRCICNKLGADKEEGSKIYF